MRSVYVATMLTLFVLGSVGFWILIGIAALVLFIMTEIEQPGWATVTLIGTFCLLAFLGNFNLWHVMRDNPMAALFACGAYVGVGAIWSVCKWWFYVRTCLANYRELRDLFMEQHKLDKNADIPDNLKKDFRDKIESYKSTRPAAKPLIRENKSRITIWMTYWPWSMTWTLINDPVKKMFRWIYQQLQGVYQRIADHSYRHFDRDLVK